MIKTILKIAAHATFLFSLLAGMLLESEAFASNWVIIHKDNVQTVFVDMDSIKRTPESTGAWVKGDINAGSPSNEKRAGGYQSFYEFACNEKKYRVTETTIYYTDKTRETTSIDAPKWKNTIEKVFFLYEYLCNQSK